MLLRYKVCFSIHNNLYLVDLCWTNLECLTLCNTMVDIMILEFPLTISMKLRLLFKYLFISCSYDKSL